MAFSARTAPRRFLVPEVVQTSAMDCGPAALKCLLEGFGTPVNYGRLREACQTDVDGTSIDTLEAVAYQMGLQAEQVMLPEDYVLLASAKALPSLIIVRQPNGGTHFVVLWRRHGRSVQVMDPAVGRRWLSGADLVKEMYLHYMPFPAADWRAWAGSAGFVDPLRERLLSLGLSKATASKLIDTAVADESWRSLATLDAATRMIHSIIQSGGLRSGTATAHLIEMMFERTRHDVSEAQQTIPNHYWIAQSHASEPDEPEQLLVRGAVLVSVAGPRDRFESQSAETDAPPLPVELAAALEEKRSHPGRELIGFLRNDGILTPLVLLIALLMAAGGLLTEALMFRVVFDLGRKLGVVEQRLGAMAALVIFSAALLCLELPMAATLLRYGRRLETRLRLAFLQKIPRLGDRYFQSRLISDMADRSHQIQLMRNLPTLGGQLVRLLFTLTLTTAGIIWLDPAGTPVALTVAAVAVGLPLMMQTRLTERDLRVRNHNGALSRFYLDALLGLMPLRTHGAERAMRREHEGLLVEWMRASFGLLRTAVAVEAAQAIVGFGLAAWLLFDHLSRGGEVGGILLLVYWALSLPALGQQIALIAQQYPMQRNITLRVLEPLGAPEDVDRRRDNGSTDHERIDTLTPSPMNSGAESQTTRGIGVTLENVSVRAGGHMILEGVNLQIEPGSHVAIVGPSGAGKSSLVGLLLGWHRPATGHILIDGEPLNHHRLENLRQETAWVDPSVQLWNRSLLDNLRYGAMADAVLAMNTAIDGADLRTVLEKMPDGLQTTLGDGGALVSGGEGQRVRLGRAMLRPNVRLVILDEPFRGLDRVRRRELMARVRELWREATILCITHDVSETQQFDRVLVVDHGQLIEDGAPIELAETVESRYETLLQAENDVRMGLWAGNQWRQLRIEAGRLVEEPTSDLKEDLPDVWDDIRGMNVPSEVA